LLLHRRARRVHRRPRSARGGETYADDAFGIADEATALAGLRIGRDRGYWSTVRAGAGPFAAVTYRNLGGVDVWGVALGGQLWGGN
jgi:hypothetical protein